MTDPLKEYLASVGGVARDAAALPSVTMARFRHFTEHPEEREQRTTSPESWHKNLTDFDGKPLTRDTEADLAYHQAVVRARRAEEEQKEAWQRLNRENAARRAAAEQEVADAA